MEDRAISLNAVINILKHKPNANPSYWNTCDVIDRQDTIDDVMELPSVTPQQQWIPVSERLPEETIMVLVSCDDMYLHRLNPCVGWRNGVYWYTFSSKGHTQILYPLAWMPLSEPYEP